MPSITTWARLEPQCRSDQIDRGLQARVHDPLWMLARQWQFGEFRGEDAGSPAAARFRMECAPVSRYQLGSDGAARPYDLRRPLETLVEQERVIERRRLPSSAEVRDALRIATQTGLHWLRLLRNSGVKAATIQSYVDELAIGTLTLPAALAGDDQGRSFARMARRVPDGLRLKQELRAWQRRRSRGSVLPGLAARGSAPERTKVARSVAPWLEWFEGLFSEPKHPGTAWLEQRMEYQFAVAAKSSSGEIVLEASEYHGGHLDWHTFAITANRSLGLGAESRPQLVTQTLLPGPATFRGMPAARWWEFEDGQIDFGAVDAEPDDLGRLILVEFALLYGNDWFVIPIEVPIGTVCLPRSLVIIDTFGERTLVPHHTKMDESTPSWRMFELTSDARTPSHRDAFFLPPTLATSLHGAPLEEVLFGRDEGANMAWAIERVVEGIANQPVRRFELYHRREQTANAGTPASGEPVLRYRLATDVPDYWIPLLPEQIGRTAAIQLRRGARLDPEDGSRQPVTSLGRILGPPQKPLIVFDEEVPRSGARVTRGFQYARWIDGSSYLWLARQKRPGRGEGSSGLRFDVASVDSERKPS